MEQRKNERELHKWEVRQDTSLKCFSQCHTLDLVFWLRTVLLHGLFSRLLYFLTRRRHDSGGKYREGDRIIKEVFAKSDFSILLYYLVAQPLILLLFLFLIQFSHRLLLKRQWENGAIKEARVLIIMAYVSLVLPGHLFIANTMCYRHQH